MGWVIALVITAAYVGIGMLCVPFIARGRLVGHREGRKCDNCRYSYEYGSRTDEMFHTCATAWASVAWMIWPLCMLTGYPKLLATGALAKDSQKAARLKVLEAEAAEQERRVQREIAILRGNDPLTMTKADFERKMVEATPAPKKARSGLQLLNPFG